MPARCEIAVHLTHPGAGDDPLNATWGLKPDGQLDKPTGQVHRASRHNLEAAFLTVCSRMVTVLDMAGVRQFDRAQVLDKAVRVFRDKGFAGTSTEDLVAAMGIGRQSIYNTYGDKRTLFLAALQAYQDVTVAGHIERLTTPSSVTEGLEALLGGVAVDDDDLRALGCFGVASVAEFGTRDDDVCRVAERADGLLRGAVISRVNEGRRNGELDPRLDASDTADLVLLTLTGLQVAARGGARADAMRRSAASFVDRLRAA